MINFLDLNFLQQYKNEIIFFIYDKVV